MLSFFFLLVNLTRRVGIQTRFTVARTAGYSARCFMYDKIRDAPSAERRVDAGDYSSMLGRARGTLYEQPALSEQVLAVDPFVVLMYLQPLAQ